MNVSKKNKAIILSFFSGFLSLALEVVWIRLFTFLSGGLPQVFSFTLALFLIGIAIGALLGKDICKHNFNHEQLLAKISQYLLLATLLDLAVILSLILIPQSAIFIFVVGLLMCAVLRGVVFPIVHHLGTEQVKTGAAISNVYFANVLGSTIAPIFVGFVLLEYFTTQQTYLIIMSITLIVALFCAQVLKIKTFICGILSLTFIMHFLPEKVIHNLSTLNRDTWTLQTLIENKHGVIQEFVDSQGDHIVYGGNIYDGAFNTSLFNHNSNIIQRAYLPLITHSNAKKVLVIGLSTGSWAKVLTLLPSLEEMTIVELNPGYVSFADSSHEMKELIQDPRVKIVTDDGRRYLSRHPDQHYDLILMNTTHYFRNQATSILSQQFLDMVKQRLNQDGLFLYNTTGFKHSFYTAKSIFPYVYDYHGMVFATFHPIKPLDASDAYEKLKLLHWANHNPVFKDEVELNQAVKIIRSSPILPYEKIDFSAMKEPLEIITDENMISEYKYGYFHQR